MMISQLDENLNVDYLLMKFYRDICIDKGANFPDVNRYPYLALSAMHLLDLLGNPEAGVKIMSRWIDSRIDDGTFQMESKSRDKKRNKNKQLPSWYLIRSLVHLSILVDSLGRPGNAYAVLKRSLYSLKELFKSKSEKIIPWKKWPEKCSEFIGKKSKTEIKIEEGKIVKRIYFTYMTQGNLFIRAALRSAAGDVTASSHLEPHGPVSSQLLEYAEYNASVPTDCYPSLTPPNIINRYKANFLANYGKLIVALAGKGYYISSDGGTDLTAYLNARKLLIQALELLRPFEKIEYTEISKSVYTNALKPYNTRTEIAGAKLYLTLAERALGLR